MNESDILFEKYKGHYIYPYYKLENGNFALTTCLIHIGKFKYYKNLNNEYTVYENFENNPIIINPITKRTMYVFYSNGNNLIDPYGNVLSKFYLENNKLYYNRKFIQTVYTIKSNEADIYEKNILENNYFNVYGDIPNYNVTLDDCVDEIFFNKFPKSFYEDTHTIKEIIFKEIDAFKKIFYN